MEWLRELPRMLIGLGIIAPVLAHDLVQQPWACLCTLMGALVVFRVDEKVVTWVVRVFHIASRPSGSL